MIKIDKIFIFLILFGMLGCGYQPVLKNTNYDISVKFKNINGDDQINSFILNDFKRFSGEKIFYLDLSSTKTNNIISKDSKGDPNVLEIFIEINYSISSNNDKSLNRKTSRRMTYNNISDKFEMKKNEEIIIKDLTLSISQEIISMIKNF